MIVRIAEGLGNQMFMYSHSYSLSKKLGYDLFLDDTSGYFKKKNQFRSFELDKFNISAGLCLKSEKFDTIVGNLKRKFLKKTDFLRKKKIFFLETIKKDKNTKFYDLNKMSFADNLFVEGYFQSEKYFADYSNEIKKQFILKNEFLFSNNQYSNSLKNENSVSICIRQNRFSEGITKNNDKSFRFTKETIDYIYRAVNFFQKKINNPVFYLWSNDFENLNEYFDSNKFRFIENSVDKSLNDFYLFQNAKHFIVGPTPFHWWGAWLNENPYKICVRPSNLNPSNNLDFWPKDWISI